jgi:hypothetical protein
LTFQEVKRRLLKGDYSVLNELSPEERGIVLAAAKGDARAVTSVLRAGRDSVTVPIEHFLSSPDFMGEGFAEQNLYPIWRKELAYVCNPENDIHIWFIRGAMGTGKSYAGALSLVYNAYETSTYTDPAKEFGLAEGSPIVFALYNATKYLAEDVNYEYLTEFIGRCEYFAGAREQIREDDRRDRKRGNSLSLPKGIRIALASDRFMTMGKNVFSGLLDEANWRGRILSAEEHQKTYNEFLATIRRMKTRFGGRKGGLSGLMVAISSEREMSQTMDRMVDEFGDQPYTHITQLSLWDARPMDGDRVRFFVGIPKMAGIPPRCFEDKDEAEGYAREGRVISVPARFREDFENDIYGALNDFAGVRADTGTSKFFYLPHKLDECVAARENPIKAETVVHGINSKEPLSDYFEIDAACALSDAITRQFKPRAYPKALRVIHTDLAINGDCVGMACACLGEPVIKRTGGMYKTSILPEFSFWVDFVMRIQAPPGDKIDFSALRQFQLWLNQTAGYQIGMLSWDGFESEDNVQIMTKRGFTCVKTSVDKTTIPYSTLRDVFTDLRINIPHYDYLTVELKNLENTHRKQSGSIKVDHPKTMRLRSSMVAGSKDVADAVCAAVYHLVVDFASHQVAQNFERAALHTDVEKSPADSLHEILLKPQNPTPTLHDLITGVNKGGRAGIPRVPSSAPTFPIKGGGR